MYFYKLHMCLLLAILLLTINKDDSVSYSRQMPHLVAAASGRLTQYLHLLEQEWKALAFSKPKPRNYSKAKKCICSSIRSGWKEDDAPTSILWVASSSSFWTSHFLGNFPGAAFTTLAAGFWSMHYEHFQDQRLSLFSHILGIILLKNFSGVSQRPDPKLEPSYEMLLPLCKELAFPVIGLHGGGNCSCK